MLTITRAYDRSCLRSPVLTIARAYDSGLFNVGTASAVFGGIWRYMRYQCNSNYLPYDRSCDRSLDRPCLWSLEVQTIVSTIDRSFGYNNVNTLMTCINSVYNKMHFITNIITEYTIKGAGGYLGVRLWKMSLNTLLIEGVMVVI